MRATTMIMWTYLGQSWGRNLDAEDEGQKVGKASQCRGNEGDDNDHVDLIRSELGQKPGC